MPASVSLTIEARIPGQRRALLADRSVPLDLDPASDALTLRELLTAIVTREVGAFDARQARDRLARVLLPAEIEQGAARGKIDLGGHDTQQTVDAAAAVAAALQAFEDRLFLVVLDGTQLAALDQPVVVHEGSHLLFVRLVALVGG